VGGVVPGGAGVDAPARLEQGPHRDREQALDGPPGQGQDGGHGQLVAGEPQPARVAGQQGPLGGPAELGPDHGRDQHPEHQPTGHGRDPQAAQDRVVAGSGEPVAGDRGQQLGPGHGRRLERERGQHHRPPGQLPGPQPDRPGERVPAPLGPVPRAPHGHGLGHPLPPHWSAPVGGRGSGARLLVTSA